MQSGYVGRLRVTDLIARLTELEKQATPGDWVIRRDYVMVNPGLREVVVADVASEECDKAGPQNAELIVALHDAFPTILRALKVQQAAEEYVNEVLKRPNEWYFHYKSVGDAKSALVRAVKGET
jgi:hypothetical protein